MAVPGSKVIRCSLGCCLAGRQHRGRKHGHRAESPVGSRGCCLGKQPRGSLGEAAVAPGRGWSVNCLVQGGLRLSEAMKSENASHQLVFCRGLLPAEVAWMLSRSCPKVIFSSVGL